LRACTPATGEKRRRKLHSADGTNCGAGALVPNSLKLLITHKFWNDFGHEPFLFFG
jgi:hypothetical protein